MGYLKSWMVLVLIRVLEMEGDKTSVLLLSMHSLHYPVSFLALVMRGLTQHVCFIIICKFASFCSCSWTRTHIWVYSVPDTGIV